MTPVTQTMFYEPDVEPEKQRGNCVTAVVASLLDLPIEEVPNFVQDEVEHEDDFDYYWWNCVLRFVKKHNHGVYYVQGRPEQTHFPLPEPDEFYLVSGPSPRDPRIHHIVIFQNGEMVWDPHPDRTGLLSIDYDHMWTLRPLEES